MTPTSYQTLVLVTLDLMIFYITIGYPSLFHSRIKLLHSFPKHFFELLEKSLFLFGYKNAQ